MYAHWFKGETQSKIYEKMVKVEVQSQTGWYDWKCLDTRKTREKFACHISRKL